MQIETRVAYTQWSHKEKRKQELSSIDKDVKKRGALDHQYDCKIVDTSIKQDSIY